MAVAKKRASKKRPTKKRVRASVADKIKQARTAKDAKAQLDRGIRVDTVDLKKLTPKLWKRLSELNEPETLFTQGGIPVRVVNVPEHAKMKNKRPAWIIQAMLLDLLRHEVVRRIRTYKVKSVATEKKGEKENVDVVVPPPEVLLHDMLATRPEAIPLPVISRVVFAPIVAPGGTVETTPGYHASTGVFYVDGGLVVPRVSKTPREQEVKKARELILEPLQDFPFVADADKANAVALMFLPFVRDLVDGPTPLHLVQKTMAGEGGTLLVDTLLYPALGADAAHLAPPETEEEWAKQITATLLDGPQAIVIDNARELKSAQLSETLTSATRVARILGTARNAYLKVEAVWAATGIAPTLHTEILRRTVPIQLESGSPTPWIGRTFKIPKLREWNREHRPEMVWAVLTLVRHWFAKGCPKSKADLGMFESWAQVIGSILENAKINGFLDNLKDVYEEADLEGDALRWLVAEWLNRQTADKNRAFTSGDVALWALNEGSPVLSILNATNSDKAQATAFGILVRKLAKGRVFVIGKKNYRVVKVASDAHTGTTYMVAEATKEGVKVATEGAKVDTEEGGPRGPRGPLTSPVGTTKDLF